MKKFLSVSIIAVMLFASIAFLVSAEEVTSTGSGFSNVSFSNGYHGFCIDADFSGAYSGDKFTLANNTSAATNNDDNSDVSQQLKILFTQCFEDLFISDGNGGYVIDSMKADSSIQSAIWHFTDGQYIWGESKALVEKVKAYTGPEIPDEKYTRRLDNGDTITFYFTVAKPQKGSQQSFFAYKIDVKPATGHVHDYSDGWKSDDNEHWHECDCGDKKDIDTHSGKEPDCVTPSVCEECGKKLNEVNPDNHTGNTDVRGVKPATEFEDGYTGDIYCSDCDKLLEKGKVITATHEHNFGDEWKHDEDGHWHECLCDEKTEELPHNGGTPTCIEPATCDDCLKPYGNKDPDNHVGGTEIRNYVAPEEFKDGYSGDTYCKGCDELLKEGEVLKATHVHSFGEEWQCDGENHWHECDCGEKKDIEPHEGGTATCIELAICDDCTQTYGSTNPDNHTGETEVINRIEPTEDKDGYSGDTCCKDCEVILELGEVLESLPKEETTDSQTEPTLATQSKETEPDTSNDETTEEVSVTEAQTEPEQTTEVTTDVEETTSEQEKENKFKPNFDINIDLDFLEIFKDIFTNIKDIFPDKPDKEEATSAKPGETVTNPDTEKSTDAPAKDLSVPDTGDNSNLIMWSAILLISVIGVYAARKKSSKKVRG